jgi:hypothetical protein
MAVGIGNYRFSAKERGVLIRANWDYYPPNPFEKGEFWPDIKFYSSHFANQARRTAGEVEVLTVGQDGFMVSVFRKPMSDRLLFLSWELFSI